MDDTRGRGAEQATPSLQWALRYAALGWRVVPVWRAHHGVCRCPKAAQCDRPAKHPRTRHGIKGATTDEKRIKTWKWKTANVGIATGQESGLVVIDIDPRHGGQAGLRQLQERLGVLPSGLVAKTGGGGWHLFFRHPGRKVPSKIGIAPGVDVRGDGGFIVAPPSIHKDGDTYSWQTGAAPPPDLPAAWVDFLAVAQGGADAPTARRDDSDCYRDRGDDGRPPKTTKDDLTAEDTARGVAAGDLFASDGFIDQCIKKTIPTHVGKRHDEVFRLARYLQGNAALRNLPTNRLRELRPIVDRWYNSAVAKLGNGAIDATIDENWWDFREGWDKVKYPGEDGLMAIILERARQNPLPQAAMQYQAEETRLLVALCRELQRENGIDPFYLSTTMVARLFNLGPNRMRPWRWLDGLVRDGILELVEKGDPEKRRASRFRYLGD